MSVNKPDRSVLLDTAMNSPRAVASHDRDAWLGLFADCHIVEDPVGSKPHFGGVFDVATGVRGRGALERFFDTFIAPNNIVFHVDRDMVCDYHVVRDLTIEIHMAPTVITRVPMHLLYELVEQRGQLKIQRLAAHWELGPMLRQTAQPTLAHLRVNNALGARMFKLQGLSGVGGFMRALSSVGENGKAVVHRLGHALTQGDTKASLALFTTDATVAFPYGTEPIAPPTLLSVCRQLSFTKMLAAGDAVTASFTLNNEHRGVAFFYFNRRSLRISRAVFYWDD
jgi:hypothetical protein